MDTSLPTPWQTNLRKVQEYLGLVWLNLKVQTIRLKDYFQEACAFYSSKQFREADLTLIALSFLDNPFKISKEYLEKKQRLQQAGEEIDLNAYGETPLKTLQEAMIACKVKPSDTVFELGAGRGRLALWINSYLGCPVVAVEEIPAFVNLLERVKKSCHLDQLEVLQKDYLTLDFSKADVIYLYGTLLQEKQIERLITALKATAKSGTKIITASYPLTEYTKEPLFEVLRVIEGRFPWGTTSLYIQTKK